MKKLCLLVTLVLGSAIAGASAISTDNGTTSPPKTPPVKGMTKAQARQYYGEPFTQMAIDHGTRWYYRLKFDEVYGRALVPFYFDSPNVRWGSIDFGADGRVTGFDWQRVLQ